MIGLAFSLALSGCGQSKLVTENEQLKQQLDSTTKKADKAESDLKAVSYTHLQNGENKCQQEQFVQIILNFHWVLHSKNLLVFFCVLRFSEQNLTIQKA